MVNSKIFEHKPISELFAVVKNDFRKYDNEGLIDEGTLIKTVMYCNDKLGLSIKEIREVAIPVNDFKAELPDDFEKVYYVAALECSNSGVTNFRNPWDNSFDSDIIWEAQLDRASLGCVDNYRVEIKRETGPVYYSYNTWTQLNIAENSWSNCQPGCPNMKDKGRYTIEIKDGHIETPFRQGTLYLMYIGMMKDAEGNMTFPFHPMITPYYEWMLKEKILNDCIFNSDIPGVADLFRLAQQERLKAWLDAYNFTVDNGFGEYVDLQRKKELNWYAQYFKYFQ